MDTQVREFDIESEMRLAGPCGLYCGLCPRYQSQAPSRCLSCHAGEQHDYCSVYRCCVRKNGIHTCAECDGYPCERLLRVIGEGQDSFVSHKPMLRNLERIRREGVGDYLLAQYERRKLVEYLLDHYNEDRSMTAFCTACALMEVEQIRTAIDRVEGDIACGDLALGDVKASAKAMRAALNAKAAQAGIDLRLRRGCK